LFEKLTYQGYIERYHCRPTATGPTKIRVAR
jgi:hypothetical protein